MNDQQLWDFGTTRLRTLTGSIPVESGAALSLLLYNYRTAKEEYAAIVAETDAAAVCRECRGQCCLNGKYRISSLDYLAHLAADVALVTNFDQKPLCPYGSEGGCSMEPGLRPSDCVLFVCDVIDRNLSPQSREKLSLLETNLRGYIQEASQLLGEELGGPLLLGAEKNCTHLNLKV